LDFTAVLVKVSSKYIVGKWFDIDHLSLTVELFDIGWS